MPRTPVVGDLESIIWWNNKSITFVYINVTKGNGLSIMKDAA